MMHQHKKPFIRAIIKTYDLHWSRENVRNTEDCSGKQDSKIYDLHDIGSEGCKKLWRARYSSRVEVRD
jgi:hypothetical protein